MNELMNERRMNQCINDDMARLAVQVDGADISALCQLVAASSMYDIRLAEGFAKRLRSLMPTAVAKIGTDWIRTVIYPFIYLYIYSCIYLSMPVLYSYIHHS